MSYIGGLAGLLDFLKGTWSVLSWEEITGDQGGSVEFGVQSRCSLEKWSEGICGESGAVGVKETLDLQTGRNYDFG